MFLILQVIQFIFHSLLCKQGELCPYQIFFPTIFNSKMNVWHLVNVTAEFSFTALYNFLCFLAVFGKSRNAIITYQGFAFYTTNANAQADS